MFALLVIVKGHQSYEPHRKQYLHELDGEVGFNRVIWAWAACAANCLAIRPLGESLAALFRRLGPPLNLQTILMIAEQMLTRVQFLYRRAFAHGDIKPDTVLIGTGRRQM
jgi:hypothetical protein